MDQFKGIDIKDLFMTMGAKPFYHPITVEYNQELVNTCLSNRRK